ADKLTEEEVQAQIDPGAGHLSFGVENWFQNQRAGIDALNNLGLPEKPRRQPSRWCTVLTHRSDFSSMPIFVKEPLVSATCPRRLASRLSDGKRAQKKSAS